MKVLIWILCIFAGAVLLTLIRSAGVELGAIPMVVLYALIFWVANTLCKKWDENHSGKGNE